MTIARVEPKKSRAGRKSDLERAQIRHTTKVEEAKLAALEKRATPIDPLRKGVLYAALGMAATILVASAVFSFATIAAVAEWMMPAWGWLVWVVPFFVELFIVFFGIDAIVNQARGRVKDARSALVWMLVFSAVAVVGNASHTLAEWGDTTDWRAWVGTGFSALAPLGVVLIVKRVAKLVFAEEVAQ